MQDQQIASIKTMFASRLDTLSHLLDVAGKIDGVLDKRIAPDMLPFGTQIAFTCNQPRGFALWCQGQPVQNLSAEVSSLAMGRQHIADTKALLQEIKVDDAKLEEVKRIELGPTMYVELRGHEYVRDFLVPNFYFHLTTAYDILRMNGAQIGKADFMTYIGPLVKQKS